MNAAMEYRLNVASGQRIAEHLLLCDADFVPPLSGRVEIRDYAQKIASKATRFEAWSGDTLAGLVAVYCNDQARSAFITSVSVLREWTGKGIAAKLMKQCIEHSKASGMRQISLEVAGDNAPAIRLYGARGFVAREADAPVVTMDLDLESGKSHERQA
jgi:ribosomal protein S18 acetylase RimI-like enzyme